LTEIGREYYERCSQILHELQEADEVASALQVTPRGRPGSSRWSSPASSRIIPKMSLDLRSGDALPGPGDVGSGRFRRRAADSLANHVAPKRPSVFALRIDGIGAKLSFTSRLGLAEMCQEPGKKA
jgi:hypothetical protein